MARKNKKWIQKAVKNRGSLKRWLKRNRRKVAGATKSRVFKKDGSINIRTLKKFRKTEAYERLSPEVKRRINLAITLNDLRKK